ncbi:MAG: DUF2851 family protein [Verrucomicrobiae bacterium]|nr:DUF2851 family protein [Verrucomicrobiae bacterium]
MSSISPNEFALQRIWLHQRIRRDRLRTLDGQSVVVLHPGIWNRESGPDFRNAILQFDDGHPVKGDVEVDVARCGWHAHAHNADRAYQNVILHVVWEAANTGQHVGPPVLVLRDVLDSPLPEILQEYEASRLDTPPPSIEPGACAEPFQHLTRSQIIDLVTAAAKRRLLAKANAIRARARHVGWEQALWEGLFTALGYKHNVWPMRRIAELLPMLQREGSEDLATTLTWESRLFGLAGLLPLNVDSLPPESKAHARRLWDHWWREQSALSAYVLPSSIWRLHGLRPANQPVRRLALAASWLATPRWISRLDAWLTDQIPDRELAHTLGDQLNTPPDEFWIRHWTFRSASSARPLRLLGKPRLTDIAMNVILPWFLGRANSGHNSELKNIIEHRYFAWPAGEDNALLRFVRQRLLATSKTDLPPTAATQQGLIQLARDYCDQSNVLCEECELPDLLQSMIAKNRPDE